MDYKLTRFRTNFLGKTYNPLNIYLFQIIKHFNNDPMHIIDIAVIKKGLTR